MAKKLKSLNPIIGTGYKTLSKIKDGEDGNIENFPDTLPKIPRLSYKRLGVSGLEIGWEFEDKIYYTYELYGSTTKGFEASEENLMFQGLASSYFYEAKPGEKWYFKARAKNTHGRYTEFSSELVTYTVKLDNLGEYVEGGSINGALIENATINNAHIKDLHADKITAGILDADRIGANSITANKIEANAITSEKIQANAITSGKIQANAITTDKLAANIIASNHIQSGTITSGHIQSGTIESDHIKSNSINSNHIQANTIQSEHIQTGAITAGSGIIAEGAIGSAQISSLDAAKIEAGTIDTSKVTIQGADGHLRLKGNRMQVFQGTGNQARERVSLGDVNGNGSVYGLRVRGADGTTILLDENGVKSEGITDGAITNDKISDDANIDGAKLNINSVVNKINEDGTETIQGTKIEVDGTTLNTKLSTITTKQTEDSERITQAQSQITANTNAIKLKVDEQTYTTDKRDMTSKLEKNTSEISAMKGKIALKVEQTDIENAKSEMEGVIDTKVDSAKAEIKVTTDAISQNVSNLSQTVSTKADSSTVTTLSNKVGSLETSVNGISGKVTNLEKTTTNLGNSVSGVQGEVETLKSDVASLEVTTSGISQKVSNVETTTSSLTQQVTTAQNTANSANTNATNAMNKANDVNNKVDNIQIGGRNLFKGFTGNQEIRLEDYQNTGSFTQFTTNLTFNPADYIGEDFTISFYAKSPNGVTKLQLYNQNGNPRYFYFSTTLDNNLSTEWKYYKYTFRNLDRGENYSISNKVEIYAPSKMGVLVKQIKVERGNKATDWTPAPEDIDSNLNDVKNSLNSFQNTVNTTFKDGIIEEAEAKAISQLLKTLDTEKANIDKEYSTIYSNANLTGSTKTNLASAKTSFDSAHASLKSTINTVISDGRVSSSESASVTSTFNTYNTQLGVYKQRVQEALDAIGSAKVDNVQIGGRNLAKNSIVVAHSGTLNKDDYVSSGTLISTITGTHQGFRFDSQSIYEPNQKYVLSFNIQKQSGTINQLGMIHNGKGLRNVSVVCDGVAKGDFVAANTSVGTILNDGAVHKIEVYYTTPATIPADTGVSYTYIQLNKESGTSCSAKFTNFKLEKGIKATDWTPAPEDIDGAINSVDGKVTTLQGEYNTTKSKVATLETNLDGITQRVSSTETTTSSLTSQINNKENKNDRVIYAKGNGNDAPNNSQVKVGSNTLVNGHGRGLNILALNPTTLEQYYNGTFDTYGGDNYKTQFAEKIQELNNGNYIIVVTSHDSACLNYATVCDALYLIGGSAPNTSIPSYREAYALIGKSKLGKGNGLEMYIPKTATDTRVAEVSVKVSDQGALLGVNSNNSESKIDTLTTRVSSAESKLTKDSLTTTIGNHYTTSNDVNGIVTSKGYATTSEVKQTTNELTATFKGSGGYNLLYNGNFKRSFEKWTNTGATIANNLSCPQNQTGILLSGALTTTKHCVQSVNMETLKPFTVSFWQYTSSAGSDGATNPYRASQITITYSDNTKTYHSTGYQTVFDTWELRSITIKPTKRVANINVELWNRDTTKSVYYTNVMLEYGSIYTEWSPNPNEVYDGVTTIDKDGIKVSQSNYNGYTQMKADGFYVNNGSENVISVTSSGATFKGKVTIQSGSSVPTSTLSGTISSNQLNSSITSDINNAKNNASSALSTANTAKSTADTAKSTADSAKSTATSAQSTANTANTNATNALNTANSVNSTVNSNKDNWSNAYNRVKEWASGAVTGTTNINGGMIATNTITANKMAIADFTNYCEMNVDNCSTYGFTKTTDSSESNNYWMKLNSLNRDIAVTSKKNYEMYKGNVQGTYRIFFEFNSTVKGATTSGGTDSVLRPIGVGLYCKDKIGASKWYIVSCTSFTSGANTSYTGTVTLDSSIVSFGVYVQIEGHAPFTGQLLIRNIKVNKMANGELIVDGAITADKIASRVINADKIVSGTITSNEIKAGTITATQMAANSVTADKIAAGAITANKIASGAITATMITSGTLDASKVNVTNLNASNIKSGKLSANYIDATNLSVKGELLSGQINGIGGMKFADGAIISSYDSHVPGYKGIQISAPSIKLGDKVDIYSPTLISTVTGKSSTSSTSSSWTMSSSGGLNCSTINTSSTTTIGGSLNVRNNMINGMNNLQMGRGSVYIPIFGSSSNFDYIKGGRGTIAFADTGPIHFLYNGTKSSFIAGGSVYLPHAGTVNCDHFRLGAGIIASPSSGSFHFLTANGATSPLYAGILYSATRMSLDEPMVVSSNSVFDKINSIDVIETKDGLRLYNPIQTTKAIDKSTEVVKTEYDEDKNEINTSIDYTSAIATLWKAVQELKQENNELKEIIKDIHSKL